MAQANVGSVLVLKGENLTKTEIAGIITERGVPLRHRLEKCQPVARSIVTVNIEAKPVV